MNDEVADIASHIRKLMGTSHPLINTAKDLIMEKHTLPKWGLIVLLLSKCNNLTLQPGVRRDISEGILPQQRTLAEVTEMVKTSNILHNTVQNYDRSDLNNEANYGNKLALLSGDYLLSTSFKLLAEMKNQEVNELISTALRDLNESNFIGPRDEQNRAVPEKPKKQGTENTVPVEFSTAPYRIQNFLGFAKSEWIIRNLLGGASLLARACEASMILSGDERKRKEAHVFGRQLGLVYQLCQELQAFENGDDFELVSAPILFHLQYDTGFYQSIVEEPECLNYSQIRETVKNGPGIQKTVELKTECALNALEELIKFPECKARYALERIIQTM
ncbi:all trans-polyprenyl-diphosphate synthase PDSS2 isoform X2 [Aethina tumida]|nr:all trans-polyprenyl-diphosphate synthase PDSS2 isoform X2 [Aethina tumida]